MTKIKCDKCDERGMISDGKFSLKSCLCGFALNYSHKLGRFLRLDDKEYQEVVGEDLEMDEEEEKRSKDKLKYS